MVNDKGPMAAFLVAGKAILDAGYPLKGDLIVSAVAGEISREPIEEWQGPAYLSKDLGARFMVTHGAVADFALVAEGTGLRDRRASSRARPISRSRSSPTPRATTRRTSRARRASPTRPNAIVRTAAVIAAFERWAYDYQVGTPTESPNGTIVPKAASTPSAPAIRTA